MDGPIDLDIVESEESLLIAIAKEFARAMFTVVCVLVALHIYESME